MKKLLYEQWHKIVIACIAVFGVMKGLASQNALVEVQNQKLLALERRLDRHDLNIEEIHRTQVDVAKVLERLNQWKEDRDYFEGRRSKIN